MNLRRFLVLVGVLLLTLGVMLGGCQKKEEAKMEEHPATQEQTMSADTTMTADTSMATGQQQ